MHNKIQNLYNNDFKHTMKNNKAENRYFSKFCFVGYHNDLFVFILRFIILSII